MPKIHDFQQTVTLADGVVLNGYAGFNEVADDLWVWLDEGTDMATAFMLFSDPARTAVIKVALTADIVETHYGYTKLALIREDGGKVTVRLKGGDLVD